MLIQMKEQKRTETDTEVNTAEAKQYKRSEVDMIKREQ